MEFCTLYIPFENQQKHFGVRHFEINAVIKKVENYSFICFVPMCGHCKAPVMGGTPLSTWGSSELEPIHWFSPGSLSRRATVVLVAVSSVGFPLTFLYSEYKHCDWAISVQDQGCLFGRFSQWMIFSYLGQLLWDCLHNPLSGTPSCSSLCASSWLSSGEWKGDHAVSEETETSVHTNWPILSEGPSRWALQTMINSSSTKITWNFLQLFLVNWFCWKICTVKVFATGL